MALSQQRPTELDIYDSETDPTPVNEIVMLLDHPSWPEPKKAPANLINAFYDWATASLATLLSLLGISESKWNEIKAIDVSTKVDKVPGSSLIADTEKTRLEGIIAPQVITLSAASDISGKITGATKPTGWTLTASDTALVITHNLTGKQMSGIIVKEVNAGIKSVCVPFEEAYTGITEEAETITIEGINPVALQLIVIISFV